MIDTFFSKSLNHISTKFVCVSLHLGIRRRGEESGVFCDCDPFAWHNRPSEPSAPVVYPGLGCYKKTARLQCFTSATFHGMHLFSSY